MGRVTGVQAHGQRIRTIGCVVKSIEEQERLWDARATRQEARKRIAKERNRLAQERGQEQQKQERLLAAISGETRLARLRRIFRHTAGIERSYEELCVDVDRTQRRLDNYEVVGAALDALERRTERAYAAVKEQHPLFKHRGGALGNKLLYGIAGTILGAGIAFGAGYQFAAAEQRSVPLPVRTKRATMVSAKDHRMVASLPEQTRKLLLNEPFEDGRKYIVVDEDTQHGYAGEMRFVVEYEFPVSTGINPGQRTKQEHGATPDGLYTIQSVRSTRGLRSAAGIPGAFGPRAAIFDDGKGTLARIAGGQSDIWMHGQPWFQDQFLGEARISAGCTHVSNAVNDLLYREGYLRAGTRVAITGTDTWSGIPDPERQRIFRRVYASLVSQAPGNRPNKDVLRYGRGPRGINLLSEHLVNDYRSRRPEQTLVAEALHDR